MRRREKKVDHIERMKDQLDYKDCESAVMRHRRQKRVRAIIERCERLVGDDDD